MTCRLALPTLHGFTGNDCTSAFHVNRKVKAFNIMKGSEEVIGTFSTFGDYFTFYVALSSLSSKRLYADYMARNQIRPTMLQKFCSKKKCPEPQQLPPTRGALLWHCISYVTAVVVTSEVQQLRGQVGLELNSRLKTTYRPSVLR